MYFHCTFIISWIRFLFLFAFLYAAPVNLYSFYKIDGYIDFQEYFYEIKLLCKYLLFGILICKINSNRNSRVAVLPVDEFRDRNLQCTSGAFLCVVINLSGFACPSGKNYLDDSSRRRLRKSTNGRIC